MSRPRKQTVDYFPHCTVHKKTIYILEQQFGNDGYAFWFKLLEVLGSTDGHIYNTKDSKNWFYLISRAGVDTDTGTSILNLLSSLEAIDHELWSKGIIWCQNFVDNLTPLYKKRMEEIPSKPVSGVRNPVSGVRNPQRIGKDSKGKNKHSRENGIDYEGIVSFLNSKTGKKYKSTTEKTRELIRNRMKDFTFEDFKKVIEIKSAEWKDTDNDKFLRPETLFGTKFEGYLNQQPPKPENKYGGRF